nr:immunoglobulin heavy chain junction region [Macaca mulatta]MOV53387.1 immunoglobulin heavy chain junction region [Macaca mulatta]MOV53677.1 immunoglobulin heavy chain junction region [Macaca mulatta]MOV53737.1 immunoglobulin heavy chain junction region [Macaca mulatta]MOV53804.1 immunoglobulin heavy chain junction region [Macaca mulatta]
CTTQGGYSGW